MRALPTTLAPFLDMIGGREKAIERTLVSGGTLGFVAYLHWVLARPFVFAPIGYDEQFFLYEGYAVGRGLVPYRDFQEFKPPMTFFANMLSLKLFGLENNGFRYLFVLLALAGFISIAAALLSRGVHPLLVIGLDATMAHHFFDPKFLWGFLGTADFGAINITEELGISFFMMAVGVLLYRTRWERTKLVVGGVLLALSPFSKEPFAVPAIAAWLALMALHQNEGTSSRAWLRFATYTVLAAVSVAMTWIIYLLVTRSTSWYLLELRETFVYANDHNIKYGLFPNVGFWGTWAENWRRLKSLYVNPAHMEPFIPFFAAATVLWTRRRLLMATLVLATYLAGIYAVTIGHGLASHYYVIAMTGTFFAATMGTVALGLTMDRMDSRLRLWISGALCAAGCYAVWPDYQKIEESWASVQTPPLPVDMRTVLFVQQHSKRDDRIWNIGLPGLYVFADRMPASRIPYVHDTLLHIYPGNTDEERLAPYRAELETHVPKLVVLGPSGADGRARHMELLVNPFLAEHHYKRISPADMDPVYELPE
jgi:hypothetical protein